MADLATDTAHNDLQRLRRDIRGLKNDVAFLRSSLDLVNRAQFRDGVIPPNALQQATAEPGLVSLTSTDFALEPTPTMLLSAVATVPDGFSSCVISILGRVFAINSTASDGYLSTQLEVAGVTGNAVPVFAAATGSPDDAALNVTSFATVLEDLNPGSAIAVELVAWTDAATWVADPSNLVDMTGSIVWFA